MNEIFDGRKTLIFGSGFFSLVKWLYVPKQIGIESDLTLALLRRDCARYLARSEDFEPPFIDEIEETVLYFDRLISTYPCEDPLYEMYPGCENELFYVFESLVDLYHDTLETAPEDLKDYMVASLGMIESLSVKLFR